MTTMKVYGLKKTPNTNKAELAAKYAGVNIDVQNIEFGKTNKTPEFLAKFPFGKIPAMETTEGPIYESNAIAHYICSTKPELVGQSAYEQAVVMQYICSHNAELTPFVAAVVYPALGYRTYNEAQWKVDFEGLMKALKVYDNILLPRTFFVGESVTVVDIIFACTLEHVFSMFLEASARKELVNLTRWYVTMMNQENFKSIYANFTLCEKAVDPSKAKPVVAAPAVVAAVASNEDEEEEVAVAAEPKKNALDLLPPSKFKLDDWKRFYSNCKQIRPVAFNWFWENFDREGYSIWRANYKYNNELKMIFMSCNLVTGLYARMDYLRRYCFASTLIFGEDNNNEISGYFVFRGTEMPEMMTEVPDYESYEWTRMDIDDPKQVALFNDYLEWEGELEGKKFADGKIFK